MIFIDKQNSQNNFLIYMSNKEKNSSTLAIRIILVRGSSLAAQLELFIATYNT